MLCPGREHIIQHNAHLTRPVGQIPLIPRVALIHVVVRGVRQSHYDEAIGGKPWRCHHDWPPTPLCHGKSAPAVTSSRRLPRQEPPFAEMVPRTPKQAFQHSETTPPGTVFCPEDRAQRVAGSRHCCTPVLKTYSLTTAATGSPFFVVLLSTKTTL